MSATSPASMTPPLPPAVPSSPRKPGSPLAGFFIDLGIGVLVLLSLSLISGLVWGCTAGRSLATRPPATARMPRPWPVSPSSWANLVPSPRS